MWFKTKPGKGKDAGKFVGEYRFDPEDMTPDLFVTIINDSLKDISNVKITIELDSKHLLWVKTIPEGTCNTGRSWNTFTTHSIILPKANHLKSQIKACFRFMDMSRVIIPQDTTCYLRKRIIYRDAVNLAKKTNDCLDELMETTYGEKLEEIKHEEKDEDVTETYYTLKEAEPEDTAP